VRIVSGRFRGRTLPARPPPETRPTSDRVREAIASALAARGRLEGARVLDLFCGTGALGLEALSRGAQSVLAVDSDARAVACVKHNAKALAVEPQVRVLALDLLGAPHRVVSALGRFAGPFDLVFADPPYALAEPATALLKALHERGVLRAGTTVAFEHGIKARLAPPAGFEPLADYVYGDTAVHLWEAIADGPSP
jgi:16S rRNA (guanine966-N2)-methyltransferase